MLPSPEGYFPAGAAWVTVKPLFVAKSHAASFAEAPEEEGRQEPSWPDILPKYLKQKLKKDDELDVDAALRKVAATRAAGRAKVSHDELDAEVQQAKDSARDISRQPSDTKEAEIEKMQSLAEAMNTTQLAKKKEIGSTEQWIAADSRRDFAQGEQLEAEEQEQRVLQAIHEAEAEAQRRTKGRNTIVGNDAENKFGMIIHTKEACDAEKGTEWHNGKCVVSGESRSPDTPEEVAAMKAVNDAQEEFNAAKQVVHDKNHIFKEKQHKLNNAKIELESYRNHHPPESIFASATPEETALRQKFDAVKAEWDVAHDALNAAKADSWAKRTRLSEALREAISVEHQEEQKDEADLDTIDQVRGRAHADVERSEDEIAKIEEEQAEVVGGIAQKFQAEARKHPVDSAARQDMEGEATWYRQWQHDAEAEAKDLHDRNLPAYIRDHVREQQDAVRENDASRKAFADAAAEGRDQDAAEALLLKPEDENDRDPKAILKEESSHLEKLMKTDAGAGDDELKATKQKSEVQNHRNAIEFREFANQKALHDASKPQAALCFPLLPAPPQRRRRRHRGFL